MSVSVSQIGIGRSLDRSIDQSRFPGQSLDQSICVCRCLYKEQHPPTRSHFCRKILRLVDLFSISSSHPLNLSRTHTANPRSRDIVHIMRSHREDCLADPQTVARPPDRSCSYKTPDRSSDMQENSRCWASEKSWPRKCTRNAEEHDEESRESGTERRTMHRRPTWVPRTKLTRYVNCLSNLPLVYIYRYINILCIYVHTHICVRVYDMCVCLRARRGFLWLTNGRRRSTFHGERGQKDKRGTCGERAVREIFL